MEATSTQEQHGGAEIRAETLEGGFSCGSWLQGYKPLQPQFDVEGAPLEPGMYTVELDGHEGTAVLWRSVHGDLLADTGESFADQFKVRLVWRVDGFLFYGAKWKKLEPAECVSGNQ